jgi:hypothetical protein
MHVLRKKSYKPNGIYNIYVVKVIIINTYIDTIHLYKVEYKKLHPVGLPHNRIGMGFLYFEKNAVG